MTLSSIYENDLMVLVCIISIVQYGQPTYNVGFDIP